MIKNASNLYPFAIQDQLSNGLTGQTPSVFLRQDNGSFAAASGSVTEVDSTNYPGLYQITLTAAECNCNVLTIAVSLPDGQEPAILDVVYPVTTGGATPAEIWQYTGGRMVDNTIPTVNDIWGRQAGDTTSRTITNTIPSASDNATAVWSAQTKEVTINSTQAETFATTSALSSVADNVAAVKAKTDNLPASPAAVGSAMTLTEATVLAIRNGLATITATDALAQGLDTLANHGDTYWLTADVSGLSTFNPATDAVTLTDAYDAAKTASQLTTSDLSALATSAEITALASVANDTLAGMLYWRVVDDTLITYGSTGSIRGQYTITKDSTGNIVKIEPIPSNDGN